MPHRHDRRGPRLADRYKAALKAGYLTDSDIDRVLVRLFSARYRNGDLRGIAARKPNATPVSAVARARMGSFAQGGRKPCPAQEQRRPAAQARRARRGDRAAGRCHARAARQLFLAQFGAADLGGRRSAPGHARSEGHAGAVRPSITDGDLVTDGNFLTPDGQPGLRAVYYNAIDPAKPRGERTFSARPVVTRIEANLQSSAMQLKEVSDAHKVVWTASSSRRKAASTSWA
jgi:beta-glucosidase